MMTDALSADHPAPPHDHDLGLQSDLQVLIARRRALGLIAALGAAPILAACGPPSDAQPNQIGSASDGGECVAHPEETAGPFPADGSNRAHGELADALQRSGVVREDMRGGFGGLGGQAEGALLTLTLRLLDVNKACAPLPGRAIYLWHCDAAGKYSIYERPETNYLRAVGIADAQGRARFVTIFPGCYNGRYPHMHFEVYPSLEATVDYRNRILTSQIAMPEMVCTALYKTDPRYEGSLARLESAPLSRDGVFSDNTPEQLAAQTADVRIGDLGPGSGFVGAVDIGLAL